MNQQESWYASQFINRCGGADHALSKYVEGETWAVQIEGSPGSTFFTVPQVVAYMAACHGLFCTRKAGN